VIHSANKGFILPLSVVSPMRERRNVRDGPHQALALAQVATIITGK